MARGIDWDKARKRQIVWERGGIPFWKDGWAPTTQEPRATTRSSVDAKHGAAAPRLKPGPYTLRFTFEVQKTLSLLYRFTDTHPEHRDSLPLLVERLAAENPKQLIFRLERRLLPDYSFHCQTVTESDDRYEFAIEIRPRKRRLTEKKAASQPTPHTGSAKGYS